MNLPKIDLSILPDLPTLTALFGNITQTKPGGGHDDAIVILATFIYDANPPSGLF